MHESRKGGLVMSLGDPGYIEQKPLDQFISKLLWQEGTYSIRRVNTIWDLICVIGTILIKILCFPFTLIWAIFTTEWFS
jgi:hypothetical protein